MAEEARMFQREDVPFSGKIADVFTITGQGTFVMLEETVGRPRAEQRLEVVQENAVVGSVVLAGLEQALRPQDGSQLVLRFRGTPGVRLERGQLLRVPQVVERAGVVMEDRFVERLRAFVPAVGWTTLASLIAAVVLWVILGIYPVGIAGQPPTWVEPVLRWFSFVVSVLAVILAAVWLTSLVWLRRLAD